MVPRMSLRARAWLSLSLWLVGPSALAQAATANVPFPKLKYEVRQEAFASRVEQSPDGRLLAAVHEHSVTVWDAATGKPRGQFINTARREWLPPGKIELAAFAPDGGHLVIFDDLGTLRAWSLATGKELSGFPEDGSLVAVTFVDGGLLATASGPGAVRFWDLATGKEQRRVELGAPLNRARFTADGQRLVEYDAEKGALAAWDVASGKQLFAHAEAGFFNSLTFSPDGGRLVTVHGDYRDGDFNAQVWDAASGKKLSSVRSEHIKTAVFSPDGSRLATGGAGAQVWEAATGKQLASFPHGQNVNGVAFSPDGARLATGSSDQTGGLWDIATGKHLAKVTHLNALFAVAFSRDGGLLFTVGLDWRTKAWSTDLAQASGRAPPELPPLEPTAPERKAGLARILEHGGGVSDVDFSPDGTLLATASMDGHVWLWDVGTGRARARLAFNPGILFPLHTVRFSPDGRYVAATALIPGVAVWDVATGCKKAFLPTPGGNPHSLAFSQDSRLLAVATGIGTTFFWELETGKLHAQLRPKGASNSFVKMSPEGTRLLTREEDSADASVWDVASGEPLLRLEHDNLAHFAFSAGGARIVTAEREPAAIRVWEAASGKELRRIPLGQDPRGMPLKSILDLMAFSADGRYAAGFDSQAHQLQLWELTTGRLLRTYALPEADSGTDLVFSRAGRHLALKDNGPHAWVWDVETGREVIRASTTASSDPLALSPDGAWLATASSRGLGAQLWRTQAVAAKKKPARPRPPPAQCPAFLTPQAP